MQYSLPDIRDEGAYIKSLHPDTIYYARDKIKHHYESVLRIMDDVLKNQWESECKICGTGDTGYKDIPEGWAYLADVSGTPYSSVLLCGGCIGRWYERFDLPELSREMELPDYEQISSVPEDTTHRGQANLGLV